MVHFLSLFLSHTHKHTHPDAAVLTVTTAVRLKTKSMTADEAKQSIKQTAFIRQGIINSPLVKYNTVFGIDIAQRDKRGVLSRLLHRSNMQMKTSG